jgi:hypothetical protein
MNLIVIIIIILCFTAVPVAIVGDIVRHYDKHHNITACVMRRNYWIPARRNDG